MLKGIGAGAALALSALVFATLPNETHANGVSLKVGTGVLRDTAGGRKAPFVVYLRDQADVSAAYAMRDQDARGWYVYRTLRAHAARSQAPLRAWLRSRGVRYRAFWAANVIVTAGRRPLVDELAARSDVARIESDARFDGLDVEPLPLRGPLAALESVPTRRSSPATVEPGVNAVHAPALWSLGFTGQGMVIASADTGVRWTHAALKNHYRGWNGASADNNYNWHDAIHSGGGACGSNSVQPCDDNEHGTHTTGTAVGGDGGANQIGVAPGAKWIGCRNMDQGSGSPATYTECFQFFIAPTDLGGANPDPAKRPDVVTNSWACPASEGCAANTLQTIVQNTEAAGIFVEASAGNGGPSCSTVSDPPAIYASAFSTGAVDSSNNLASFSSRGPVIADGSNRTKPDVVAPGVNVRSATNASDSAYASLTGTSMAGPHVAGVVALLWSARPGLVRNIAATKQVLTSTANPAVGGGGAGCGGSSTVPNNHFGWGLVDALAASTTGHVLTVAKSGAGTGTVTSAPAGINCGAGCAAVFGAGDSVTLTAGADAGSTFSGWSGDCSGTGACTLTMSADHSVTAGFAAQPRTLVVAEAGNGAGAVTSSPAGISCRPGCSAGFAAGSQVTLTASADVGSIFSGWSGDCSGTGLCTLTMSADHSVTASFALQPRTLFVTINPGLGRGNVTSSPAGISCPGTCTVVLAPGSSVTLTANVTAGFFGGWEGDCSGTSPCTLTMSADRSVGAAFGRYPPPLFKHCAVPNVKGMLLAKARRAVIRAHCSVGRITHAFSTHVRTGRVISQRPAPKAQRKKGARVSLVVSKGKRPRR
jgi:serine protease AprX